MAERDLYALTEDDPTPQPSYWTRASGRTEAEREQRFQQHLDSTVNYFAAVEAHGGKPWHGGDVEARRELFNRRYDRPSPPDGLGIPNIRRTTA